MEILTNKIQGLFTDITGIMSPSFKHLACIWVNYSHKTANFYNEDGKRQQKLREWHERVNTLSWMVL